MCKRVHEIIVGDPALAAPVRQMLLAAKPPGPRLRGSSDITLGFAAFAAGYPVLRFVVREIGLPWLHEANRYSEMWRIKVDSWVDGQYRSHGIDVKEAQAMTAALRRELERINAPSGRQAWQKLAAIIEEQDSVKGDGLTPPK